MGRGVQPKGRQLIALQQRLLRLRGGLGGRSFQRLLLLLEAVLCAFQVQAEFSHLLLERGIRRLKFPQLSLRLRQGCCQQNHSRVRAQSPDVLLLHRTLPSLPKHSRSESGHVHYP